MLCIVIQPTKTLPPGVDYGDDVLNVFERVLLDSWRVTFLPSCADECRSLIAASFMHRYLVHLQIETFCQLPFR